MISEDEADQQVGDGEEAILVTNNEWSVEVLEIVHAWAAAKWLAQERPPGTELLQGEWSPAVTLLAVENDQGRLGVDFGASKHPRKLRRVTKVDVTGQDRVVVVND